MPAPGLKGPVCADAGREAQLKGRGRDERNREGADGRRHEQLEKERVAVPLRPMETGTIEGARRYLMTREMRMSDVLRALAKVYVDRRGPEGRQREGRCQRHRTHLSSHPVILGDRRPAGQGLSARLARWRARKRRRGEY